MQVLHQLNYLALCLSKSLFRGTSQKLYNRILLLWSSKGILGGTSQWERTPLGTRLIWVSLLPRTIHRMWLMVMVTMGTRGKQEPRLSTSSHVPWFYVAYVIINYLFHWLDVLSAIWLPWQQPHTWQHFYFFQSFLFLFEICCFISTSQSRYGI